MSKRPKHYLSLSEVQDIYIYLNGSSQELSAFRREAKKIATKFEEDGRYEFHDEKKLFELFQAYLPEILEGRNIYNFDKLMQHLPDKIFTFLT